MLSTGDLSASASAEKTLKLRKDNDIYVYIQVYIYVCIYLYSKGSAIKEHNGRVPHVTAKLMRAISQ